MEDKHETVVLPFNDSDDEKNVEKDVEMNEVERNLNKDDDLDSDSKVNNSQNKEVEPVEHNKKQNIKQKLLGTVFNYIADKKDRLDMLVKVPEDIRRTPEQVLSAMSASQNSLAKSNILRQVLLSIMGGILVGTGSFLSIIMSIQVESYGIAAILKSFGFVMGFNMITQTGSALFTSISVIIPVGLMKTRRYIIRTLIFWLIVFVFNLIGTILFSIAVSSAQMVNGTIDAELGKVLDSKLNEYINHRTIGGWFSVVMSGVLANFFVGTATFLAFMGRTVADKLFGLIFPVMTFVLIGGQHSPANMGFFFIGLFERWFHGSTNVSENVNLYTAFVWNIFPSAIGNWIGGVIFIALYNIMAFSGASKESTRKIPIDNSFNKV